MKLTGRSIERLVKEWCIEGESGGSFIEELKIFIVKEREIYTNLNLLNIKNEIFDGQYWCSELEANDVENSIKELHQRKGNLPHTTITRKDFKKMTPPTHF